MLRFSWFIQPDAKDIKHPVGEWAIAQQEAVFQVDQFPFQTALKAGFVFKKCLIVIYF